jgi:hypothetical protein
VKRTNLTILLLVCFCGCGVVSKDVKNLPNDQYAISFNVWAAFGAPTVPPIQVLDEIAYGICPNGYKTLRESTSYNPFSGRSYYYVIMCNSSQTSRRKYLAEVTSTFSGRPVNSREVPWLTALN